MAVQQARRRRSAGNIIDLRTRLKPAPMPAFVPPMLCTLVDKPFDAGFVTALCDAADLDFTQDAWPDRRRLLCHIATSQHATAHSILRRDDMRDARPIVLRQKVDGANAVARLTDAMSAAIALIELHRIPRDVVVDDGGGALQIQSFRGEVGGHEHIDLSALECVDRAARNIERLRDLARCGDERGEDQRRLIRENRSEEIEFVRCRRDVVEPLHLFANGVGIDCFIRRHEQIPEEELLERVGVFFLRESAAIVALRQRAAALEYAFVEAALAFDRFGKRCFARFQPPPQKLSQQWRVAGERELQCIDWRVGHFVADDVPIERAAPRHGYHLCRRDRAAAAREVFAA